MLIAIAIYDGIVLQKKNGNNWELTTIDTETLQD